MCKKGFSKQTNGNISMVPTPFISHEPEPRQAALDLCANY